MSGRVALLTGATGFIGSHLVARLLAEGWDVHCIIKDGDDAGLARMDSRACAHVHDGTTNSLIGIAAQVHPDVAFHLASLFLARHTSDDITGLVESNVLFGTQLLEALSLAGCTRLVNTGTAWQHHHTSEYRPVCLYAATKQAFEDIARFYVEANNMSVLTIKLNDTYGPGDPRPKIVQLLMNAARTATPLRMSPGEQTLDLLYIDDIISGFVRAAELLQSGEVSGEADFGLPSGEPVTLRQLAEKVSAAIGLPVPAEFGSMPYREREVMSPWLTGTALPGWVPSVTLAEGLRRTWDAADE